MKFKLTIIILSFVVSPIFAYAARSADPVQKQINLSSECSKNLINFLNLNNSELLNGIPIEIYGRILNNNTFQLKELINNLKIKSLSDDIISIGPHWNDNSGAIPRKESPRFYFSSVQTNSLNEFKNIWGIIVKKLTPELKTKSDSLYPQIIANKEICKGLDNLFIKIYQIKNYEKFGNPHNYMIIFEAGEMLPEINLSPTLDN